MLAVAEIGRAAAAESLGRTTGELASLAAAGVVDAGGQAYVLLLDVLIEILGGPPAIRCRNGPSCPQRLG